jgi:hypothetical protein
VRMGYRLGAFLGAGPEGRVMAARLLLAVAAAATALALFTIEASAG